MQFSFAFAMSVLDLTSSNPYSRLPNTIYIDLKRLKLAIKRYLFNPQRSSWYKDVVRNRQHHKTVYFIWF